MDRFSILYRFFCTNIWSRTLLRVEIKLARARSAKDPPLIFFSRGLSSFLPAGSLVAVEVSVLTAQRLVDRVSIIYRFFGTKFGHGLYPESRSSWREAGLPGFRR